MSTSPTKKLRDASPYPSLLPSDLRLVDNLRVLCADVVQKANSGHPGAPMGCAPMGTVLFRHHMRYAPTHPDWINRDRFVLSNGHGCALLYTLLHLSGFAHPTMEDLKRFRQMDSLTPGHPEANHGLAGVEVTTGPLGQGISSAVGLAMAERHLGAVFNRPGGFEDLIDNYTFCIVGDGCLQEGVSSEASSLAGHLGLSKLIVLYDDNGITIDGETHVSFTEDVAKRYEAYGWRVLSVPKGDDDLAGIWAAVQEAKAVDVGKPTLIKVKTTIGFGSLKQGTEGVHGAPLGAADIEQVKKKFNLDPTKTFEVEPDALQEFRKAVAKGETEYASWTQKFAAYTQAHPDLAKEFTRRLNKEFPEGWEAKLPVYTPKDGNIASRNSSEKVLNALAALMPEIVGGSADLTGSNKTQIKNTTDFQRETPAGRYIRFGVREHGMAAVCNGLEAYGMLIPFGATFLNFAGYAAGGMRLSALSKQRVLYIMTHDSIGLGEDGPTHQPVETLIHLRATPNMYVFRPADATEVVGSYVAALKLRHAPSTLCFSRQDLPCLEKTSVGGVAKGGYVVSEEPSNGSKIDAILVSTGSEVYICMDAAAAAKAKHNLSVRVVSMPCNRLFDEQSLNYRMSVFPSGVPVVSVEAASIEGWAKYAHVQLGMTDFGKSAPYKEIYKKLGFEKDAVADKVAKTVEFYKGKPYVASRMEAVQF